MRERACCCVLFDFSLSGYTSETRPHSSPIHAEVPRPGRSSRLPRRPAAGFGEEAQREPVLEAGDVLARALERQALGARGGGDRVVAEPDFGQRAYRRRDVEVDVEARVLHAQIGLAAVKDQPVAAPVGWHAGEFEAHG